jgi:thiamine pyrophosphate-dependent acetolactate synthase large subunit-like protein
LYWNVPFAIASRTGACAGQPLDMRGPRRFGTGLKDPNIAAMAEAVGIRGIGLEDPGEVDEGIAAALAHDGPVLVDAVVIRWRCARPRIDYDIANPGKEAYGSRHSGEP